MPQKNLEGLLRSVARGPRPSFWDDSGSEPKLVVIAKLVTDLTLHRLCPCKLQLNDSNVACQVPFAQFSSGLGLVRMATMLVLLINTAEALPSERAHSRSQMRIDCSTLPTVCALSCAILRDDRWVTRRSFCTSCD